MNASERRATIRRFSEAVDSFVRVYCDEADEVVCVTTDDATCSKCGADDHPTIYAENQRCLALLAPMHGGGIHGDDATGLTDVEFPTIRQAASFVETLADPTSARLRDAVTHFDLPVVVQVAVSRETRLFPSAREIYRGR